MHIILFDTDIREALLPFTFTKPVCELRVGILTIREKWELMLPTTSVSYITSEHLEPLYQIEINDDNLLINGAIIPNGPMVEVVKTLHPGEALMLQGELVAARLSRKSFEKLLVKQDLDNLVGYEIDPTIIQLLDSITSITEISKEQILPDMQLLRTESLLPEHVEVMGEFPVFIHPDAKFERAYLNASEGAIYIGANAWIMDGASIRGPVSIGKDSVVKSHAVLWKGVCIGPGCEVGGEIKQSVFLGFSNKSHEGYIGDSVIGEWCNLGALTTNSNLRNSFTEVSVWNYSKGASESCGRRKCGFFMGDYSRTAINTMINAGTVIGVSTHVFGRGTASSFIPSFTWGGIEQMVEYQFEKAIDALTVFRAFKQLDTSEELKDLMAAVFMQTSANRPPRSS